MKVFLAIFFLVSVVVADPPANMPVSVAAGGAVKAVNTNGSQVKGTVGQGLVKLSMNTSGDLHSGFWPSRHASAPLAVERVGATLPTEISFEAAYPNPFNPATQLSFSIPSASRVTLNLFDVTGRVIATLADDQFQAGSYAVTWNAESFASGTYFARLETAGFTHTQKLVYLK
ncbi:MAG: T9SS type A sorting domain-containing protein [Calditrichaeota bacterium]|nr:T9SS type A sorting domain-containing protein [Calditrichota bacterium]